MSTTCVNHEACRFHAANACLRRVQPTAEVLDDFIELATKLAVLNTNIESTDNLGDVKLQKRLEAITMYVFTGGGMHFPELKVNVAPSTSSQRLWRRRTAWGRSAGQLSRWEMSRSSK